MYVSSVESHAITHLTSLANRPVDLLILSWGMPANFKVGAQRKGPWCKPMVYDTTFFVDGEGGFSGGFRLKWLRGSPVPLYS